MIGCLPTCSHVEPDWQVLVGVSTGGTSWYGPQHTGNRLRLLLKPLYPDPSGQREGWCFHEAKQVFIMMAAHKPFCLLSYQIFEVCLKNCKSSEVCTILLRTFRSTPHAKAHGCINGRESGEKFLRDFTSTEVIFPEICSAFSQIN